MLNFGKRSVSCKSDQLRLRYLSQCWNTSNIKIFQVLCFVVRQNHPSVRSHSVLLLMYLKGFRLRLSRSACIGKNIFHLSDRVSEETFIQTFSYFLLNWQNNCSVSLDLLEDYWLVLIYCYSFCLFHTFSFSLRASVFEIWVVDFLCTLLPLYLSLSLFR